MPLYIHLILLFAVVLLLSLVRDHGRDKQVWPTVLAVAVSALTVIMWVYMAFHW